MGNTMNSTDEMIASAQNYGMWNFSYFNVNTAAITAATTTSGYVSCGRNIADISIPTFGSGINCAFLTMADMFNEDATTTLMIGIEYNLGEINIGTGTFTDGVAMPTKTVGGASVQTAAMMAFAHIDTALTGTAPALTVTYTDQDGNTGNTCSMTLPATATATSSYFMIPHLANGDTAIRDITACSRTGGTAGVVSFRGILPLAIQIKGNYNISPLLYSLPKFPIGSGEKLAIYRWGATSSWWTVGAFAILPDT